MISQLAVVSWLLFADPGAESGCLPESMLVFQARTGDKRAQKLIRAALTDRKHPCVATELPGALNLPEDGWALDLLAEVALDRSNGFGPSALVTWWRMKGPGDRSLPARVLADQTRAEDDATKLVALELLADAGDATAQRARTRLEAGHCARARERGDLGLGWSPSTAASAQEQAEGQFNFTIGFVCAESAASKAGFAPRDRVMAVNDVVCDDWARCLNALGAARRAGTPFDVAVATENRKFVIRKVVPAHEPHQPHKP